MAKDLKPQHLRKKVAARQKFIAEAVGFIQNLVDKHGREISDPFDLYTKKITGCVCGFSFAAETGKSKNFWYRVTAYKHHRGGSVKVLQIFYESDSDKCEVEVFEDGNWPRALRRLIKDPALAEKNFERHAAMLAAEQERQENQRLADEAKKQELKFLTEEAGRLKIFR